MKTLTKILLAFGLLLGSIGFIFLTPRKGIELTIAFLSLLLIGATLLISALFYIKDSKSKAIRQVIIGIALMYGAFCVIFAGTVSINQTLSIILLVVGITLVISTALFHVVHQIEKKKQKK